MWDWFQWNLLKQWWFPKYRLIIVVRHIACDLLCKRARIRKTNEELLWSMVFMRLLLKCIAVDF